MLTERQIEIAARKLCEIQKIDPDAVNDWASFRKGGVFVSITWFDSVIRDIRAHTENHTAVDQVIAYALAQPE